MHKLASTILAALLTSACAGRGKISTMPGAEPTRLTGEQQLRDLGFAPNAAAILDAYSSWGAQLTRSGLFVFLSNRDGLPQLYVGDAAMPAAPPRRLPSPKERVAGFALMPDEKTVLFRSDTGADQQFHIFSVGIDGNELTDLTPGEKLQRGPPIPARAKSGVFAYGAHATTDEKARLFLQTVGQPPREVFSDPRGGFLQDLMPDGSNLLFGRFNGSDDIVIFEVDTGTGQARRIYPPEGTAVGCTAVYSSDASRILVAAHHEGKPSELLAVDRKSGEITSRYQETMSPQATIADVVVSPKGDVIALAIDAGNHSEVRQLDARTLRLQSKASPLGAITIDWFTTDGSRMTLTQSTPDSPSDVFVVEMADGTIAPLRLDVRPGLRSFPPIEVSIQQVPAFDGLSLPVNLYLPVKRDGKLPAIVLVHGGPSASAYVRWNVDVRFFSSLGYAVVEPNIRGSTGFGVAYQKADDREKRGDALRDVESVNRWARAQSWCDPDRMIIMGTSYGGYMTLLALTRLPKLWRAGIDLSGMSDLRTMEQLEDQALRVYDETEFGKLGRDDSVLLEWSPLKDAGNIAAPLFVYQGVNDPITPQGEADQIVAELRRREVPVEYMLLPDEGHGIVRRENRVSFLSRAARFLEEHAPEK